MDKATLDNFPRHRSLRVGREKEVWRLETQVYGSGAVELIRSKAGRGTACCLKLPRPATVWPK